jgi:hypothetical protein
MAILALNLIGPDAERLAQEAADRTGMAVGFDPELEAATFDSDLDEVELETMVFAALDELDADWRAQLEPAE